MFTGFKDLLTVYDTMSAVCTWPPYLLMPFDINLMRPLFQEIANLKGWMRDVRETRPKHVSQFSPQEPDANLKLRLKSKQLMTPTKIEIMMENGDSSVGYLCQ